MSRALLAVLGVVLVMSVGVASQAAPRESNETRQRESDQLERSVSAHNTIYLEVAGSGGPYSINYERRFGDFNLRAGAEFLGGPQGFIFVPPIGFNYIGIGGAQDHLEVGATVAYGFGADFGNFLEGFWVSPILGYRLQKPEGGFNFRIGASALLFTRGTVAPWGYMSFGHTF